MFGKTRKNTHSRIIEAVRKVRTPVSWYFDSSFVTTSGSPQELLNFLAQYGSIFNFSWRLSKEVLRRLVNTVHHEKPFHCCLLDGRDCRPEEAKQFLSLLCELGVHGCIVPRGSVAKQCWRHDRFVFMTSDCSPEQLAKEAIGRSWFETRGRQNAGCAFLTSIPSNLLSFLKTGAHPLVLIEPPARIEHAAFVGLPSFAQGRCIVQLPVTKSLAEAKGGWRLDEGVVRIAKELRDSFQGLIATTCTAI